MSSGLKSALSSYASATKKVRQTVNAVIDENSFVELDAFMGGANELGQIRGEGVYCGLASVDDRDGRGCRDESRSLLRRYIPNAARKRSFVL